MTGPEHYREAERLLHLSADNAAEAQVHATLALAAATHQGSEAGYTRANAEAWAEVTA